MSHRHSDSQRVTREKKTQHSPSAATGYIWSHDFLSHWLIGLRCYILGPRHCWRSCLKPPSSVPCPAVDRRLGYQPSAASAPPPLMPDLCLLNWSSSMPLRRNARLCAPLPAPPRSAPTAQKPKAQLSSTNSWRRMESARKQAMTSRFQVFFPLLSEPPDSVVWRQGWRTPSAMTHSSASGCNVFFNRPDALLQIHNDDQSMKRKIKVRNESISIMNPTKWCFIQQRKRELSVMALYLKSDTKPCVTFSFRWSLPTLEGIFPSVLHQHQSFGSTNFICHDS